MTKKILCRVIKSVPLSRSIDAFRYVSPPSNKHHKTGDGAAADVRQTENLASGLETYTRRFDVTVSVDDTRGQILDCYI